MQIQGVKEYIGFAPDQTPYMHSRSGSEQANVSEINDIDNWDTNRFALFGNAKASASPCTLHPGETLLHAVWLVAYRTYTFAFHHHLDQRCQCHELVRLPQGFLPLLDGGAQAASVIRQCLPPL